MPAITEEANPAVVFPDLLIPQIAEAVGGGTWVVARTKAQQEKQLAFDLAARGIGYYLPMIRKVTRRGQSNWAKRIVSCLPIFPGYLPFCGDAEAPALAYATNHIWQLIEVRNQKRFVKELFNLQQAVSSNAHFGSPEERLAKGTRVAVAAGPFEGLEGIVEQSAPGRLYLNVELLGRTIPLELKDYPVEILS